MICASYNHAHIIHENDIVINEIMADPSPGVALPEWEYIELYNASESSIDISKWKIIIGKKEFTFNEGAAIHADSYLILCHNDALEDLAIYGNCYGFSSFQITNSGSNITLIDENDIMISSVTFDVSWHYASYKKDGGWSLEQIDAFNPCVGKSNWSSCNNSNGGTPGMINSIASHNIISPKLDHINPSSSDEIEVFFNQNMDIESLQNIDNYIIEELNLHPHKAELTKYRNDYVKLIFNHIFEEDKLYTLNINNVSNCTGNPTENEIKAVFGIPSAASRNDIVINEILFNPISPGVDYLELYNRSDKVIDLKEIMFGTIKKTFPNPPDTTVKEICSESRIMLPYSYILLSLDQEIVKKQYDPQTVPDPFLDVASFPSLPNEEGHVVICDKGRMIIDEMKYSDKMHYDLLSVTQGVALERISTENPSLDENNWHSASFNFNYGTPGYRNSMAKDYIANSTENEINIIPEIFSPDGDAKDDICGICYNLDDKGYTLNIKVFNSDGILIRSLLNNKLVSQEGVIYWDGCNDNNQCVSTGIYIIQSEMFDLKGNVKRCRNVVVVAP